MVEFWLIGLVTHSVIFWPILAKSEPLFGKSNNSINSYDDGMVWYNQVKIMQKMKMVMQNHAKIMQNLTKSCNFCKIMHKSIITMTSSKNHEKWCMIHGGKPPNWSQEHIWYVYLRLFRSVGNVGKNIFPTLSHTFFWHFSLRIYPKSILELRTACSSLRQNFFPQKGANLKSKK